VSFPDLQQVVDSVKYLDWYGCYSENLVGLVTPASIAHPAKMAKALAWRIVAHGFERDWWGVGDVVLDPFFGVGTVGLAGAYAGLAVIGVELEPRFVELAKGNMSLHQARWQQMNLPEPVVLQGDSREMGKLLRDAGAVITSPPYTGNYKSDRTTAKRDARRGYKQGSGCFRGSETYGSAPGQIGDMAEGNLSEVVGVISSPPYADGCAHQGGNDPHPERQRGGNNHLPGLSDSQSVSPYAGAITSPPFMQTLGSDAPEKRGGLFRDERRAGDKSLTGTYGESVGQIGQLAAATYWGSVGIVYQQCFSVLRPGGVMALVLKDFVRSGKRVPFCDQTVELLEAIGFALIERARAWQVEEYSGGVGLFDGKDVVRTKTKKSFFRILQEAKGSPRIDWEEVIFVQKPVMMLADLEDEI
jgi:hypothetical protein